MFRLLPRSAARTDPNHSVGFCVSGKLISTVARNVELENNEHVMLTSVSLHVGQFTFAFDIPPDPIEMCVFS